MSQVAAPAWPWVRGGPFFRRAVSYANYAYEFAAPWLPRFRAAGREQIDVGGLTVRCDRQLPGDPQLLMAWEDLYRRTPAATPFHSPAWQRSLLESAQATRRLRLFTVFDQTRLVGVLPLEARLGGILRTSGAVLTDYLDPLIDPNYAATCWPAILKGVRALAPGRSLILENVRAEAFQGDALNSCAAAAGFDLSDDSVADVARIALPATWEQYLASLEKHQRKELKRKLNKAETQGGAVLNVCSDPGRVFDEMMATFTLFYTAGGGKARKARWLFPRHFAASAPELAASGRLVLYKLIIENRYAAGMIALPTHDGQILWNTAFDFTMKQWSPGIVLFAMLIRRAIEQGQHVFDLLRGQYDYKYQLGAADHPLRTLTLRPAA